MSAVTARTRYVMASDPLLRSEAIAEHARDHHDGTWPSAAAASTAITGAFAAITPSGCDYSPAEGTITSPPLPAPPSWAPVRKDPQLLNCTIAALAASWRPATCRRSITRSASSPNSAKCGDQAGPASPYRKKLSPSPRGSEPEQVNGPPDHLGW